MKSMIVNELTIRKYTWDTIDTNSYLLVNDDEALLIDAVDSQELLSALHSIKLLTIILTHCHFDHISGLNSIRKIVTCKVISTECCSKNIGSIYRNMSSSGNAFMAFYLNRDKDDTSIVDEIDQINVIQPFVCELADVTFEGSMVMEWAGHKLELSQYYGHSDDSLIAVLDDQYMFSGDTIMNIPTATRFPRGSTARFWEEDIPRLTELTSTIAMVFPGHGEPGQLRDMIAVNQRPNRFRSRRYT